jgi:hypothetical protein
MGELGWGVGGRWVGWERAEEREREDLRGNGGGLQNVSVEKVFGIRTVGEFGVEVGVDAVADGGDWGFVDGGGGVVGHGV